ncbi:hypothetical protein DL765_004551 [Monosporascus sp. GIB2]|nr:hypothetical protein DL765_004551 [Monosporascus sp. GIB2]
MVPETPKALGTNPNEFYALPAGKNSGMQAAQPAAESDGCGSTRRPRFTTPTPMPRKAFKYYEVSPSITGRDPTPVKAQRSKSDPRGLIRSQVTNKLECVMSDSELWNNQDTGISLRDQNVKHEAIDQGKADLLDVQASPEREPLQTMRPASASRAASQPSNADSLHGSAQRGGGARKPRIPSSTEKDSPHSVTDARTAITDSQSRKRRRTDSSPAESSPAFGPLAPSNTPSSPAAPVSSESLSSSDTRPNKRREHQRRQRSSDSHGMLESPSGWHSKSTSNPVQSGPAHDSNWSGSRSGQLWRSSPYNAPSSPPAAKRNNSRRWRERWRRRCYKTPTSSTTNSPASSGLFVSPGSRSARASSHATHIRWTEDPEPYQASEKRDQFVRESTESTEAFLRWPSAKQLGHLRNDLMRLEQDGRQLEERWSRAKRRLDILDSKAGLC